MRMKAKTTEDSSNVLEVVLPLFFPCILIQEIKHAIKFLLEQRVNNNFITHSFILQLNIQSQLVSFAIYSVNMTVAQYFMHLFILKD